MGDRLHPAVEEKVRELEALGFVLSFRLENSVTCGEGDVYDSVKHKVCPTCANPDRAPLRPYLPIDPALPPFELFLLREGVGG